MGCKAIARAVRKAGIAGLYGLHGTENLSGDQVTWLGSKDFMHILLYNLMPVVMVLSHPGQETWRPFRRDFCQCFKGMGIHILYHFALFLSYREVLTNVLAFIVRFQTIGISLLCSPCLWGKGWPHHRRGIQVWWVKDYTECIHSRSKYASRAHLPVWKKTNRQVLCSFRSAGWIIQHRL